MINFMERGSGKGKVKRILVQVKSGKVKAGDIRDLRGTLDREGAAMGVFITLEKPSRDMLTEATSAGFYQPGWELDYPKLQILTIADLFNGAEVKIPATDNTFKQVEKVKGKRGSRQRSFLNDDDQKTR